MKSLSVVSVLVSLAVVMLLIGPVFATPPPPGTVRSPVIDVPVETTPIHHVVGSTGPLVVNWQFKKAPGSARLTVNPDGTYRFSGDYKGKVEGGILEVLLTLKSSFGGIYMFHYTGNLSRGSVQWTKQGKSTILKDDFKDFNKHDWVGSYRLHLTAEGKKVLAQRKEACENLAKEWHLPDPWIGAAGGHCYWYETMVVRGWESPAGNENFG